MTPEFWCIAHQWTVPWDLPPNAVKRSSLIEEGTTDTHFASEAIPEFMTQETKIRDLGMIVTADVKTVR